MHYLIRLFSGKPARDGLRFAERGVWSPAVPAVPSFSSLSRIDTTSSSRQYAKRFES